MIVPPVNTATVYTFVQMSMSRFIRGRPRHDIDIELLAGVSRTKRLASTATLGLVQEQHFRAPGACGPDSGDLTVWVHVGLPHERRFRARDAFGANFEAVVCWGNNLKSSSSMELTPSVPSLCAQGPPVPLTTLHPERRTTPPCNGNVWYHCSFVMLSKFRRQTLDDTTHDASCSP